MPDPIAGGPARPTPPETTLSPFTAAWMAAVSSLIPLRSAPYSAALIAVLGIMPVV